MALFGAQLRPGGGDLPGGHSTEPGAHPQTDQPGRAVFQEDIRLAQAQTGQEAVDAGGSDLLEDHVGGGVVGHGHHQFHGFAHRDPGAGRPMLQRAAAQAAVLVAKDEDMIQAQARLTLLDLPRQFDHDGNLEDAGQGMGAMGLDFDPLARGEVHDGNPRLEPWSPDQQGLDAGLQGLGASRRGLGRGGGGEGAQQSQAEQRGEDLSHGLEGLRRAPRTSLLRGVSRRREIDIPAGLVLDLFVIRPGSVADPALDAGSPEGGFFVVRRC